jgi:type III secretory pathway component EscS
MKHTILNIMIGVILATNESSDSIPHAINKLAVHSFFFASTHWLMNGLIEAVTP